MKFVIFLLTLHQQSRLAGLRPHLTRNVNGMKSADEIAVEIMKCDYRYDWKLSLSVMLAGMSLLLILVMISCDGYKNDKPYDEREAKRQVLQIQSLYNHHPAEEIGPQIQSIIDSMKMAGRSPYYFAANNILIDRSFSEGRFAEADSLAVNMEAEAKENGDSVAIAMVRRVRAQMYYKLFQPELALKELSSCEEYIEDPHSSSSAFGTATSIQEWIWIVSRELGDSTTMNDAGLRYAEMVENHHKIHHWTDSTGHYPVSALAFRAQNAFSKGNIHQANELLDSAFKSIRPSFPARAYEHFYAVRCIVRAYDSQPDDAIADIDTLLSTHKDFPWFYVKDLLLKAEVLNIVGRYEESNDVFLKYIEFHDSLYNSITEKRLQDLSILYRTELDEQHERTDTFRTIALCSVIALLVILLGAAYHNVRREKKYNQLLVRRLMDLDESVKIDDRLEQKIEDLSPIDRLDHYMVTSKPYTNPALSRKELADHMEISQVALGELINRERGVSVRTYINTFRLEDARKVLGSGSNEGIGEMAERLGFGTSRTLQRAFKERYDMSPTQYRAAAKKI